MVRKQILTEDFFETQGKKIIKKQAGKKKS